jgi:hypothetical protein
MKVQSLEDKDLLGKALDQENAVLLAGVGGAEDLSHVKLGKSEAADLEGDNVVVEVVLFARHEGKRGLEFTTNVEVFTLLNADLTVDDGLSLVLNLDFKRKWLIDGTLLEVLFIQKRYLQECIDQS